MLANQQAHSVTVSLLYFLSFLLNSDVFLSELGGDEAEWFGDDMELCGADGFLCDLFWGFWFNEEEEDWLCSFFSLFFLSTAYHIHDGFPLCVPNNGHQ